MGWRSGAASRHQIRWVPGSIPLTLRAPRRRAEVHAPEPLPSFPDAWTPDLIRGEGSPGPSATTREAPHPTASLTTMPELPEVETVRRGLAPAMVGARIVSVEQHRPGLRFPFPKDFAARLTGQTVTALDRRAKYLVAHLSSDEALVMHLGMTGRFLVARDGAVAAPGDFYAAAGGGSGPRALALPAAS